jgi:exodeoxyribonuclease VII small subunit
MPDAAGPQHADAEPAGYAEALAELDAILVELENPDLDVDRLGGQVRRASRLLTFCQERLTAARDEVEAVTGDDE